MACRHMGSRLSNAFGTGLVVGLCGRMVMSGVAHGLSDGFGVGFDGGMGTSGWDEWRIEGMGLGMDSRSWYCSRGLDCG